MAIPNELIVAHRQTQNAIQTLANRDLIRFWRTLDLADPNTSTRLLLPYVVDLTAAYGDAAAAAAADFYDTTRQASGPPREFRATAAPPTSPDQTGAMVRWAVTPIWATDPRFGAALARLAGGTQRLIRKAERDTIFTSGRRDPSLVRWVRVPEADACAFCLMVASRGDVYRTRESSRRVVGRRRVVTDEGGVLPLRDQLGGIVTRTMPRGSRPLGEKYHDNCRCDTVAIWSTADVPDVNLRLQQEWNDVAGGADDQLAAWRAHVEQTRPNQHAVRP